MVMIFLFIIGVLFGVFLTLMAIVILSSNILNKIKKKENKKDFHPTLYRNGERYELPKTSAKTPISKVKYYQKMTHILLNPSKKAKSGDIILFYSGEQKSVPKWFIGRTCEDIKRNLDGKEDVVVLGIHRKLAENKRFYNKK